MTRHISDVVVRSHREADYRDPRVQRTLGCAGLVLAAADINIADYVSHMGDRKGTLSYVLHPDVAATECVNPGRLDVQVSTDDAFLVDAALRLAWRAENEYLVERTTLDHFEWLHTPDDD